MARIVTPENRTDILAQLQAGYCVGLPTETVYGLSADATCGEAVARIFEMKGRPKFNPLIAHVSNIAMARQHGRFNEAAEKLADAFWPGPLTIVLPLLDKSDIHPLVTAGLGTIGLRCPRGFAAELIGAFGKPLAAPSANRSGKISPTRAEHVLEEFHDTDLMIVDQGPCEVGLESTIVKVEKEALTLLRPGSITSEMIERATGLELLMHEGEDIEAPGMMKSHYAPDAKVVLNATEHDPAQALLAFGPTEKPKGKFFNLSETGDLREAAANLYQGLKELDRLAPDCIYVQPIPNEGLGIAINDRLRRAAAPRNHK